MEQPDSLSAIEYNDDTIVHLEDMEHIRLRPGMYIGKLGDGSSHDDGIYVLIKEVMDNSIDEFTSGFGKKIDMTINLNERRVSIRDYGRGIPLGKLVDAISKLNTGARYDSKVFKKSIGLNGVGIKAVNALSSYFKVQSFRDGMTRCAQFADGNLVSDSGIVPTTNTESGTLVEFIPDRKLFGDYYFVEEHIERRIRYYCYLNGGLTIFYNGCRYYSKNGLLDLLENNLQSTPLYPIIHIKEGDFEAAFTHINGQSNDYYYSFVNGQHTTEGGTHQSAFREAYARVVKDFIKKDYSPEVIRQGLVCALCVRIQEPVFEAQTKTKLGSTHLEPNKVDGSNDSPPLKTYVYDILKRNLDNYLHIHNETANALLQKITANEKERRQILDIKKVAKENSKRIALNNNKLRDCHIHYNTHHALRLESTIFITEGESASGSITQSRDVNTQAVFSLRGKTKNTYNLKTIEDIFNNKELLLLHNALAVYDGIENLRYNKVVIATDADVDGLHIRLLLLTFFLRFYPELIRTGHVFILQTPLFRVRNKQKNTYCYTNEERIAAIQNTPNAEITRFKGLGEISPEEFKTFIGKDMRLDPVILPKDFDAQSILSFYMGENTPERREFIMRNLRVEDNDIITSY
ncbi:MAG: ATP-binding protein [Bacteroidaceae bacterium]|nr:ATP-binding protein [Bacteroidaceae bacterium]